MPRLWPLHAASFMRLSPLDAVPKKSSIPYCGHMLALLLAAPALTPGTASSSAIIPGTVVAQPRLEAYESDHANQVFRAVARWRMVVERRRRLWLVGLCASELSCVSDCGSVSGVRCGGASTAWSVAVRVRIEPRIENVNLRYLCFM